MRNAKISNTIIKVISYVLVVMVIIGIIGVVAYFTGGFTSEFKTFYVTVDGKDIMTDSSGYIVDQTQPLKVDVKYTLGFAGNENSGYTVKVMPNAIEGKDFSFLVDGEEHTFQSIENLNAGFDIQDENGSFTLTPKGNMQDILQAIYPDKEVGECLGKGYEDMFALVVSSSDGKSSVTIYFTIYDQVNGVTLDKELLIF